jgi:hypothetical protein
MWKTIKAILLWNFSRTTWQYDVLCLLILAFIFLTPKSWFDNNEGRIRHYLQGQPASMKLILSADKLSPQATKQEIENKVHEMIKIPNLEIIAIHQKQDADGKTVEFEVDIR